jgi:hypothetical protein
MTGQEYPASYVRQLRRDLERQRVALEQVATALAEAQRLVRVALNPPPAGDELDDD